LKTLLAQHDILLPEGPDMKQRLTKGKVVMMDDESIVMAMKTNKDDTVTAYERRDPFETANTR
jgi:hypothetical protein